MDSVLLAIAIGFLIMAFGGILVWLVDYIDGDDE